jgi:hypothetical protein
VTPGRSHAATPDSFASGGPPVMDIEASGFGAGSYPIEIGISLADGDAYCTLITPEPDWTHWDAHAEAVHGITRDTLHRFGKAASVVIAELERRLAGSTIYSDAWCHDYTWLNLLYSAADRTPGFKLASLHSVVGEIEQARWEALRSQVQRHDGAARHRASTDARVLRRTAHEVMKSRA